MTQLDQSRNSLRPVLAPRAVAVVGASRDASSVGHRVVKALVASGFAGPIYPVNPAATDIAGLAAYASVRTLPPGVDLAIVAVPAAAVSSVVDECAAAGVGGLVVLTAGYAEAGPEGERRQAALVAQVRAHGMRMVGPNCMGVLNTALPFNGSFSPVFPPAGSVALLSQSGALGIAVLALAGERQVGLSTFVSIGNSADVSCNDLLQYWGADPQTRVVLLYLESFGNPRHFAQVARAVAQHTPIVALKAGRTQEGRRAAASHTAALAARDVAVDALFHQTGVIRADTLDEMFDIASCLDRQPLPAGRRVAIVTNAGGPGILAADACAAAGLEVVTLGSRTQKQLAEHLPALAALANPVDMIAAAGGAEYAHAIATVLDAPEVDALLVIFTPVDARRSEEILEGIRAGVARHRREASNPKPVLACLMAPSGGVVPARDGDARLPSYRFPENAVRALARIVRYAEWRAQPPGVVRACEDIEHARLRSLCDRVLLEGHDTWLPPDAVSEFLSACGIASVTTRCADDAIEAVAAAEQTGYPVAMKLRSPLVLHKSDIGGVRLNLGDPKAVADAFDTMTHTARESLAPGAVEGVTIQPMAAHGIELIVGVVRDPLFGALIGFGIGGTAVELLSDMHFRVAPLTERDIDALFHETRLRPILEGYRGRPGADLDALRDLIARLSSVAEFLPEIAEIDLNPVIAHPPGSGYVVADARIRLARPSTAASPRRTRMEC